MKFKRYTTTAPGSTRTLAVEESYKGSGQVYFGIAGQGVHLSAEDAREAAALIAEIAGPAEPVRKFAIGDKVDVAGYFGFDEGGEVVAYAENPLHYEILPLSGHRYSRGCAEKVEGAATIHERSLSPMKPKEPVLEAGVRASVTTHVEPGLRVATRVKVLEVLEDGLVLVKDDGSNMRSFRFKGSRVAAASSLRVMSTREKTSNPVLTGSLSAYSTAPEDAGDPKGSRLWVTGDSAGALHEFEAGTYVEVVDDEDYLDDGEIYVRSVKKGEEWYVSIQDLSIESPRSQEIADGTKVRILTNGSGEGLPHYLDVSSTGTVKGWVDTSMESGSHYSEIYKIEGVSREVGGTLIQSLAPGSFEVVEEEPLAEWERLLLGLDEEPAPFAPGDKVYDRMIGYGEVVEYRGEDARGGDTLVRWTSGNLRGMTLGHKADRMTKVEEPAPAPAFAKGDKVRVTGNGEGNPAGEHSLKIDSIATVEDATTRFEGTVWVKGERRTGGTLGQWVLREDLERALPVCGIPGCDFCPVR